MGLGSVAYVDASTIVRLRFALVGSFNLYWPSKSHCAFVNVLNLEGLHTTMARFEASEEFHRLSDRSLAGKRTLDTSCCGQIPSLSMLRLRFKAEIAPTRT